MARDYDVVESSKLSTREDRRYVVVDLEGKVLDDAQGYGYKTKRNAFAAYAYKTRDKSKDSESRTQSNHIRAWLRAHPSFVESMERTCFEIAKGSWGREDKFDSRLVASMLKECNLEIDFSPSELLKIWKKM